MKSMRKHVSSNGFSYCDGLLLHSYTKSSRALAGTEAGWFEKSTGYRRLLWNGHKVATHQVIFFMHHGYMPEYIDHKDGDKLNNHIDNLRPATNAENSWNSQLSKANTSGVKGVCWDKDRKLWHARVHANGKSYDLGFHEDLELAELIVSEARDILHGDYANNGVT